LPVKETKIHAVATEPVQPTKIKPKAVVSFVAPRSMELSAMSVDVLDFYQRYDIQIIHTDTGDRGTIKIVITNKTDGTPYI
jgi:hypothetical protein